VRGRTGLLREPKDRSGVQVTVAVVVLLVGYAAALVFIVLRFRGVLS
jgi:hypothetical protein